MNMEGKHRRQEPLSGALRVEYTNPKLSKHCGNTENEEKTLSRVLLYRIFTKYIKS